MSEKIKCECGGRYTKKTKSNHTKTIIHNNYFEIINSENINEIYEKVKKNQITFEDEECPFCSEICCCGFGENF
jgi:hypothetical protein